MAQIEHLVVLMMENRSFDHMFGFLKSPSWGIDGLTGNESNADSQGRTFKVTPNARDAGDLTPDPGHDFLSVNEQIFGNSAGTGNGPSNIRGDDTLRGFRDYRFRDRNYFLVQTELLRELTGVLHRFL